MPAAPAPATIWATSEHADLSAICATSATSLPYRR
jgi:hypothetical protein